MNAIIIVARLESERLPQKHLQIVEGLPLIKWLTKRIQYSLKNEIDDDLKLILASPDTELNKKFEALYNDDVSVEIFRGSEKNVPLRIHECCNKFSLDKVVIADGDNFLLSMNAIKTMLQTLSKNSIVAKTEGLPLGMNVMGWDAAHLKAIMDNHAYELLETGWGRIFKNEDIKKIQFNYNTIPQFDELRFTTDYPEDLEFMKKMFQFFGNRILIASDDEIVNTAIQKRYYQLNGYLYKTYFENFYKKQDEEITINNE
jgi:spore coat polysaccharide biosynthesis protein SpsF (cytidylyltransferase family)